MDTLTPAEAALQLLFKKLHPHLEDAAHALSKGADAEALRKLHLKLIRARLATVEALEGFVDKTEGDLADELDELVGNLSPMGETYQESLTLTQLCLEDAAEHLVTFLPQGLPEASWATRLQGFQKLIEDPQQRAEARWLAVDPEIGESLDEDGD